MARKREKVIRKGQKTVKPAGGKKHDLPKKGLDKASPAILINEK
jgi:hypothetical protein